MLISCGAPSEDFPNTDSGDPHGPGGGPPSLLTSLTSLTSLTEVASLEDCPNGGFVFDHGFDTDGDGALDDDEVQGSNVVCHGGDGESGKDGEAGADGALGAQGDPGPKGDPGDAGARGERGTQGDAGSAGGVGQQGDRGERGERGDPGDRGQRGEQGARGQAGFAGGPGERGEDGEDGESGTPGEDGAEGLVSLIRVELVAPDPEADDGVDGCIAGGFWVLTGVDDGLDAQGEPAGEARDGRLDDGEVDTRVLLCSAQGCSLTENDDGTVTIQCGDDDPVIFAVPHCGNGLVEAGEACDDGNDDDTDACTADCAAARCGDGFVWRDEEPCDDGNDDETDGCLTTCVEASCGDGFVQADVEECDDRNDDDSDEEDAVCPLDCILARCGDGVVDDGEECDEDSDECVDCVRVGVAEFTVPGDGTWTTPAGVTEVKVTVIGGGGGGGAGGGGTCGGGGGGYAVGIYDVVPGAEYALVVGKGGSVPPNGQGYLYLGGNTSRFGGETIYATGGQGCGNTNTAKDGGQGFNGTELNLTGGQGAASGQVGGNGPTGGGGGYPAGGQTTNPGIANRPYGGDGGYGVTNSASPNVHLTSNAENYGGGGGGGYGNGPNGYGDYCNGAGGYVRVEFGTYQQPSGPVRAADPAGPGPAPARR